MALTSSNIASPKVHTSWPPPKASHSKNPSIKNCYTSRNFIYIYVLYMCGPLRPSKCLHTTNIHWPTGPCHISVQTSAHQPIKKVYTVHTYIRVPLSHPRMPLPQEEVVAHPHLPQAVVVAHSQDPPALAAGIHSSSRRAQLLVALSRATVAVTQCTAPGIPHPGYGSTCPQARPVTPSQDDGVYHPHLLRLLPEEHLMAPHQGHHTGASSPVSQALQVTQRPHLVAASLHVEVSPALAKPVLYTTPPRTRKVPNLHIHKATNNRPYQCLYIIHMN
jgi:hypothetical protein